MRAVMNHGGIVAGKLLAQLKRPGPEGHYSSAAIALETNLKSHRQKHGYSLV